MKIFKRIIKIILLVGILFLFVWTIYYLYNKNQQAPVVYQTTSPFVTNIIQKTVATGSVVPRKEIEITPKVSGIINKVYVEAGQNIRKGDLIAQIKIIPDMISLNNAESRVNKAQISLENAKVEYERNKTLYEKNVIADSEFKTFEIAYKNYKEELESAETNLQLIKEGVSKKAENGTTNTLVRSTIDGMVLDVPVKEGNSVIESNTFNAGTTIATIADMNEMIFEGKVDESEVGKIKEGMDLILSVGAIENEKFDAKLEYISPKGVSENGAIQFQIKASVKLKENAFIRAGYSANADIVLARKDSVLSLEEKNIRFENDSAYVEIETEPQKFEEKQIEVGLSDGINIEIKSGLNKEEKVKIK